MSDGAGSIAIALSGCTPSGPPPNQPPIANAGLDILAVDSDQNGSENVALSALFSSDPDGFIVSYAWSEAGVVLATGNAALVAFSVGVHAVELTVTDDDGASASDLVAVTVEAFVPPPPPPNQPPVANAGLDILTVDLDQNGSEIVALDASLSSDPDGAIVSYQWSESGLPIATGVTPLVPITVGTLQIDLTVTDDAGASASDSLIVTVDAATPPPPPPPSNGLGNPDALLESNHVWSGSFDSAMFGSSVADAGDVNGDGFSDIVVGAYGWDVPGGLFDEGAAFVFLGGPNGIVGFDPISANAVLLGDDASGEFGNSVSGAGDVNGDGFDDIIIGAHHYNSTIAGGTLAVDGAAFVFLGGPTGIVGTGPSTAHAAIFGDQNDCRLGHEVAAAGDVNGDGFGDIIIGAPLRGVPFPAPIPPNDGSGNGGAALVFLGSASGITGTGFSDADRVILHHPPGQPVASGDQVGAGVAAAGDVNNDGFDDVLVGAGGYIMVFHGSATGIVGTDPSNAGTKITSDASISVGARVSGAGDVNGDGYADILAADPNYPTIPFVSTGPGAFMVFHGSASGIAATSPAAADTFIEGTGVDVFQKLGWRFSAAGDVDGDGFGDVIVGAIEFPGGLALEGSAYLFRGSATGLVGNSDSDALVRLEAGQSGAAYRSNKPGFDVAGVGDVNSDGFADFLMGAGQYDAGQADEGVVLVYHGEPASLNPNQPPVAIAGADQIFIDVDDNGEEVFTFDGRASFDPDGSIDSYAWREGGTLLGTSPVLVASFAIQGAGDHVLTLTVTDNLGLSRGDTVRARVNPVPTHFLLQETFSTGFDTWLTGGDAVLVNDPPGGAQVARLGAPGAFMQRSIGLLTDFSGVPLPAGATGIAIDFWGKASQFAPSDELLLKGSIDGGPFTTFLTLRPQDEGLNDGIFHFYGGTVGHGPVSFSWFPLTATNVVLRFESNMTTGLFSIRSLEIDAIVAPVPAQNPIANAGIDLSVTDVNGDGLETLTLDGSASFDPDGVIVSYQWSESGLALASGATPAVSFGVGVHPVFLTVTDDSGATSSDIVTISVAAGPPPNQPPVAVAGQDQSVTDTDGDGLATVLLDGSASSDPDGIVSSYLWSEGLTTLGVGPTLSVALAVGSHTLSLSILDDVGAESVDTVVIAVLPAPVNQPPVAAAGPDQSVVDSDSSGAEFVSLDGSASTDVDGIIVSFEWREGVSLLGSGPTLSTSLGLGDHLVTLTVVDDAGSSATDSVVIQVLSPPPSLAPTANAGPDQSVVAGAEGTATVALDGSLSVDPDGVISSYVWSEGGTSPPPPVVLGSGISPSVTLGVGSHLVTLEVTDNSGATSTDSVVVTVVDPPPGPAPQLGSVSIAGTTVVARGDSLSWTLTLLNTGTVALTNVQLSLGVSPANRAKNLSPGSTVAAADVPVGSSISRTWTGRANRQGSGTVTVQASGGGVSLGSTSIQLSVLK